MDSNLHYQRLKIALAEAKKCFNVDYFGVGCVIFDPKGVLLATAYTGERSGEHAEETAIHKCIERNLSLDNGILYSTMEPCSIRLSKKTSCTERIISSGIKSVYFGCREPDEFVKCQGKEVLTESGIMVTHLVDLDADCATSVRSRRKSLG